MSHCSLGDEVLSHLFKMYFTAVNFSRDVFYHHMKMLCSVPLVEWWAVRGGSMPYIQCAKISNEYSTSCSLSLWQIKWHFQCVFHLKNIITWPFSHKTNSFRIKLPTIHCTASLQITIFPSLKKLRPQILPNHSSPCSSFTYNIKAPFVQYEES